jgi:hypothetical protein
MPNKNENTTSVRACHSARGCVQQPFGQWAGIYIPNGESNGLFQTYHRNEN